MEGEQATFTEKCYRKELAAFFDAVFTGEHNHKCDACGFVWRHHNEMAGDAKAHTCVCGKEQWRKYYGTDAVLYHGDGRPQRISIELPAVEIGEHSHADH